MQSNVGNNRPFRPRRFRNRADRLRHSDLVCAVRLELDRVDRHHPDRDRPFRRLSALQLVGPLDMPSEACPLRRAG